MKAAAITRGLRKVWAMHGSVFSSVFSCALRRINVKLVERKKVKGVHTWLHQLAEDVGALLDPGAVQESGDFDSNA